MTTSRSTPTRRRVVQGAVWTTPAITMSVMAPAVAASPTDQTPGPIPDEGDSTVGLQGLMNIGKGDDCGYYVSSSVPYSGQYKIVVNATDISSTKPVYDQNGQLVSYGFYVNSTDSLRAPTNAKFTLYVPSALGVISWTKIYSTSPWTNLTLDSSVPQYAGYYAYSSTFTGTWTYSAAQQRWAASGAAPAWGANPPAYSAGGTASQYCPRYTMPAAARRSVDVGSKTLTFTRSVRRLL